mmetsp:Transcript_2978/g.5622  ORF Transcript_2978/g.5622 Transcript_2978/m.5622 type:complete len:332 (+) Transcript_2978:1011-2006(+)
MRPGNEIQIVPLIEHGDDIPPEQIAGSAGGKPPSVDFLGIRPHEIAHGPVVGHFLLAIDDPYLIQGVDAGAEPPVHCEYLVLDDGREGEVIEYLGAVPPDVDAAVFAEALVVKSVDLGDLAGFVIAPDERDAVGVADFEGEEEEEGFDGVVAAVDEVAEEEVVFVGGVAAHFEEFDEVVELAVDVAAYSDGSIHSLHIPLIHQNLTSSQTKRLHFVLSQVFTALQPFYLGVQRGYRVGIVIVIVIVIAIAIGIGIVGAGVRVGVAGNCCGSDGGRGGGTSPSASSASAGEGSRGGSGVAGVHRRRHAVALFNGGCSTIGSGGMVPTYLVGR